jgi:hypothetical protein
MKAQGNARATPWDKQRQKQNQALKGRNKGGTIDSEHFDSSDRGGRFLGTVAPFQGLNGFIWRVSQGVALG